jgi:hypothetical protein
MSTTFIGNSTAIQELFKRIASQFAPVRPNSGLQLSRLVLSRGIRCTDVPTQSLPALVHRYVSVRLGDRARGLTSFSVRHEKAKEWTSSSSASAFLS